MQRLRATMLAVALALPSATLLAQDAQGTKPDNTKVNKRDRSKAEPTADQQKENKSDRETAAAIRRAIVQDKSLSTYAHNVKVIVQNGTVTLKGPVRSDAERSAVQAKAAAVAGSATITNEITIAPGSSADRAKTPSGDAHKEDPKKK